MLPKQLNIADGGASYDRRGNLVTRTFGGSQAYWTWTYDHENQLTRVQTDDYYTPEASRWRVEFVYDGQGRLRVKKDYVWYSGYGWYPTGETRYLYDGLLLVQERTSTNTPAVTYTRGRDLSGSLAGAGGIGGLLARSHGYSGGNWSSHHAYHADGNGNVTALVNSAGALQASYRYDPYGRYLAGGGPLASANLLRFSSKPWVGFAGSATSGLYYYGYRFYDPYLQRWVNRDPMGESGGINLYLFVENRPYDAVDLDGRVIVIPIAIKIALPSAAAALASYGCKMKECSKALEQWQNAVFACRDEGLEALKTVEGEIAFYERYNATSFAEAVWNCAALKDPKGLQRVGEACSEAMISSYFEGSLPGIPTRPR